MAFHNINCYWVDFDFEFPEYSEYSLVRIDPLGYYLNYETYKADKEKLVKNLKVEVK